MTLIDVLPKDWRGQIILSPGGETVDGTFINGTVDPDWFNVNFPNLANATTPLSESDFADLKAIDKYWSTNADKWIEDGLI